MWRKLHLYIERPSVTGLSALMWKNLLAPNGGRGF